MMICDLSIITINLNQSDALRKTIESVIKQTFKGYEYIIIDGGSSDNSIEVINEYSDNLVYWVSEPDGGIYNAMNKGIQHARGEYCFFLNSGDSLISDNLLEEIFGFNYTEDLIYGNLQLERDGRFIGVTKPEPVITMKSLFEGTIHHQAAFIRKKLFDLYGPYNEEYTIRGDWEFWIRSIVFHNCSTRYLDISISSYDLDGISSRPSSELKIKEEKYRILSTYLPEKIIRDYEESRSVYLKYLFADNELKRFKHRFNLLDKWYSKFKKILNWLALRFD